MLSDGIDTEWRSDWNSHDEESLPAAVRILVDGIPGLETDRWGQEIPIMATLYGDNGSELGDEEEDLAAGGGQDDESDKDTDGPDKDTDGPDKDTD
jgi:hypothetical protein